MPSSILQLISTGPQDVFLTKDPQISHFKYNYYRYVNFATDIVNLSMNEAVSFGKRTSCSIPKKGHLLSKLYLHIKLPALVKSDGEYLNWTDAIGYAIFDDAIELEIGGTIVDRLYPQFLNMYDELCNSSKTMGRNLMLLKGDVFSSTLYNASKQVDLVIPLDFWFTKQYSSALPILSMFNGDIKINFKIKEFLNCVNFDGSPPTEVGIIDSSVFAEYIFLDDVILDQFSAQKHTFLIEQTQFNGIETIPANFTTWASSLKFNHPVKELLFCCVNTSNVHNSNYFAYSRSDGDSPLLEANLLLDGKKRFESNLPEFFYRLIFPDCVHSTVPLKHVFSMPFCIRPEENQPSGSLNMSRFNDVTLSLKLPPGNEEMFLYVFAVSYNVITIENGLLAFQFVA